MSNLTERKRLSKLEILTRQEILDEGSNNSLVLDKTTTFKGSSLLSPKQSVIRPPPNFANLDLSNIIYKYSKMLFKTRYFKTVLVINSLNTSCLLQLAVLFNILLKMFDFDVLWGSLAVVTITMTGMISSLLYSWFLLKYKRQDKIQACFLTFAILSLVSMMYCLYKRYFCL